MMSFSTRLFRISLSAVLLICVFSVLGSYSQAQNKELPSEKRTQIEAAVAKFMATTHVPGLSVSVVEDGKMEWASGFGFADLENNTPVTEHTLFRLASISKPLSATAAMELVERGQLDLDAPVQKYCPAFPQKSATITTREVMDIWRESAITSQVPDDRGTRKHQALRQSDSGGTGLFQNDRIALGTRGSNSTTRRRVTRLSDA